jgi:uncharacterized protein with GYD domain
LQGANGLAREGGSGRRDAVSKMLQGVGGELEAFYFSFGDSDAVVLADIPDNTTAAAVGLVINSSGAATTRTVVLLTPEEVDEAKRKTVVYRQPGA